MNWKIKRDPFYSKLYEQFGEEFVKEAGFFEDTAAADTNILESLNVMCTPLDFLKTNLNKLTDEKPCVLLFTGSFCPIHYGHVSSMIYARQFAELLGFKAIGGYISPGHDEYISQKNKQFAIPIHKRIAKINEAIKDEQWLSVDPWEGVFNKVAVNFTDVIIRLEAYIEKHLEQKIPVVFVCGGDNAKFANTFLNQGHCIVADRPNYPQFAKYKEELKDYKNIVFMDANFTDSSTRVRAENPDLFLPDKKKQLFIRDESASTFNDNLMHLLTPYYSHVKKDFIADQRKTFNKMPLNLINLDSLMNAEFNLAISRCYDIFGTQRIKENEFVNRPGTKSIDEQLNVIPKGDYYLYDDDIHTGSTMRFAEKQLNKAGINVLGHLCMTASNNDNIEILDARDFKMGHSNGGLVMKLPNGTITRAPYIYPYVCPYNRASISDPLQFSIDVWKLNMDRYKNISMTLGRLKFKELYNYIGFDDNTSLYDICKWHYDTLNNLK